MGSKKKETKEKPLEKMTATELRELAKGIDGVAGVHGMNKPELIAVVKKSRGISGHEAPKKNGSVRELKQKIRALRTQREAILGQEDGRRAEILRRRIARLKKKTRRVA